VTPGSPVDGSLHHLHPIVSRLRGDMVFMAPNGVISLFDLSGMFFDSKAIRSPLRVLRDHSVPV